LLKVLTAALTAASFSIWALPELLWVRSKIQLYLALDRRFIEESQFNVALELCDKTARQISKLIEYLEDS